jgi:YjjG family noncanonical pyrimidine nucleotidase
MHKQINNYKWLIFDADNTLFDYDAAEKSALLKTLDDANISYQSDSIIPIYHKINHKLWMQFDTGEIKSQAEIKQKRTQQLFAILNAQSDSDAFANDYIVNLSNNAQLLKNALMVIAKLAVTHDLIIMTNGMTSVQVPRFKRSPIMQYFQHTIISEQIGYSKPSKEIFNHAFGLMNQPAKGDVLMIGDNLGSDVQGGINYGIDTIWYNPHRKKVQHKATYEVNDLLEFIKPSF